MHIWEEGDPALQQSADAGVGVALHEAGVNGGDLRGVDFRMGEAHRGEAREMHWRSCGWGRRCHWSRS